MSTSTGMVALLFTWLQNTTNLKSSKYYCVLEQVYTINITRSGHKGDLHGLLFKILH